MKKEHRWLEPCKVCGKKHLYRLAPCPSCGVHIVPRKVSENVCWSNEECDGCEAYRDHMR